MARQQQLDAVSLSSCLSAHGKAHRWLFALATYGAELASEGAGAGGGGAGGGGAGGGGAGGGGAGGGLFRNLDVVAFNAAMACFAIAGQWRFALHVLYEFPADVVTFNSCLHACETGRASAHLDVLRDMRAMSVRANTITMNTALSACEKISQWQPALALMIEMKDSELLPDVITFNAAISAARLARWQQAELFAQMLQAGIQPDEFTFAALISCAKVRLAMVHLTHMQEMGRKPNSVVYNSCLNACEKSSDPDAWRVALALVTHLTDVTDVLLGYTSAIRAMQHAWRWRHACALLGDMRQAQALPDAFSLDAAATACARAGRVRPTLRLLNEVPQAQLCSKVKESRAPVWITVAYCHDT
ncbi:unnamed protein product [Effrenium voratum]|nr:unnamed protein product [Effrenium voratum]